MDGLAYIWRSDSGESGLSFEQQRDTLRATFGLSIPDTRQAAEARSDIIIDWGQSSGDLDRPGLNVLRRRVIAGEVRKVYVARRDRLARHSGVLAAILDD